MNPAMKGNPVDDPDTKLKEDVVDVMMKLWKSNDNAGRLARAGIRNEREPSLIDIFFVEYQPSI